MVSRTPSLHVALSETIHDICKSNRLITIMNRMGLCIIYELLRIAVGLVQHIIDLAGPNRVSVPSSFLSNHIIHGAMDNFDHEENASSGIRRQP